MTKSTVTIVARPLTQASFKEFGDVIEANNDSKNHFSINDGAIERYNDLAQIDTSLNEGRTLINLAVCNYETTLPFHVTMMERHPLGSQAFIPLDKIPMIVVVAPEKETIEPDTIKAFISNGNQGINYRRNIWHMPMTPLQQGARYIMVDRGGEGRNCEEFTLNETVLLVDAEI